MHIAFFRSFSFVVLILVSIIFLICNILGFDGAYGQDAYAYVDYSKNIKAFLFNGIKLEPFIWPIGYPSVVAFVTIICQNSFIAGQLTSLLAWGLTMIMTKKLLKLKYPQYVLKKNISSLYILAFLGFSPYFFRLGISCMADVSAAFMVICTFYFYEKFKQSSLPKFLYYASVLGALSIMMRYATFVLILIPMLFTAYEILKGKNFGIALLSLLSICVILIPVFLIENNQLLYEETQYSDVFNFKNFFYPTSVGGNQGYYHYGIPNAIYAFYGFFHPACCFMGLILIGVIFIKRVSCDKLLLASLVLYSIFIGGYYFQNLRFFVIQIPLIIVFFYPAFNRLISFNLIKKYSIITLLVILCMNVGLSFYTTKKIYSPQQFDKKLSQELSYYPIKTLYTFWIDVALEARGLNVSFVNLWLTPLHDYEPNSHVLFNEAKFKDQWKNHTLMKNWEYLKTHYQLLPIKKMTTDGWVLYTINPQTLP